MKKTSSIIIMFGCMLFLSQPMNAQEEGATTGSLNGHEWVDLGLPSGTKWATCDVGASVPEQYGCYFVWGGTKPIDVYSLENVLFEQHMSDIAGNPQYDAATANWGEGWKMPTKTQMEELVVYCTWEWMKYNYVYGSRVTGPNGNSIFLPAHGHWSAYDAQIYYSGTCDGSSYWSSTPHSSNILDAYCFHFNRSELEVSNTSRYQYFCVRPVRDAEAEVPFVAISTESFTDISVILNIYASSYGVDIIERGFYWGTNPEVGETDNNVILDNTIGYITKALVDLEPNTTYYVKAYATNSVGTSYSEVVPFTTLETSAYTDYVDLGLPSGLKWATYNVGASSPEEYGNYYAWGEVVTKKLYYTDNSETYGESMSDIASTEYDAATVNWGGDWRMPTVTEIRELIDNCNWELTIQNGVNGCKVTGTNGNSIFLPAAGCRGGIPPGNNDYGVYWSSTPSVNDLDYRAYYLDIFATDVNDYCYRYYGLSVRPVRE